MTLIYANNTDKRVTNLLRHLYNTEPSITNREIVSADDARLGGAMLVIVGDDGKIDANTSARLIAAIVQHLRSPCSSLPPDPPPRSECC